MGRTKYGEKAWNRSWAEAYHMICKTRLRQCDDMRKDGFHWHWVTSVNWCDRRQKQPDEVWSVQRHTLCSDSAKFSKDYWMALHSTDAQSPKELFTAKKWNILRWLSLSPYLNPIERPFHLLKTKDRKTHEQTTTEDNWSKGLAKHHKGGNPAFGDNSLSLPAKDSWQSIKNEHFIYNYINLSNYIWAPENRGLCTKMFAVLKRFIRYFCSTPWIKAESLHFNCISIVSFQIHCDGIQSQNYENCVTVQVFLGLLLEAPPMV